MFSEDSAEMSSAEDLSQTDTEAFRCSTDSETDTSHEQISPDLFPSDEEDLPIPGTFNHEETSYSDTNAEKNNNSVIPSLLALARRVVLAKLAPTRRIVPDMTLYADIVQPGNDQMFTVCTITSLNQSKSSPVKTGQDLNNTEQNIVARMLASLNLQPGPSLCESVGVNAELETTEQVDVELLTILTHLLSVASVQPDSVQSCEEEEILDAELTLTPPSPESVNTDAIDTDEDLEFDVETILDNDHRSFVVDNIDIYRSIHQCEQDKYHLHDVPFKHVIVTGVITSKSVTQNSITQLEVDDGSAVVICLFDDDLCLPEDRNNFHKCLDSWEHDMSLFGTDAVFDETFHFLREYAKRLFQETPQSKDLNLGDEVTIIGKVFDSKTEGRLIYHKYLWRKVNLVNRVNCRYVQGQFAKHGRHF